MSGCLEASITVVVGHLGNVIADFKTYASFLCVMSVTLGGDSFVIITDIELAIG